MHPTDTLGWTAVALMVATFASRDARRMRPLAVATNLAFIGYALAAALKPVLALHLLLLPINLWRWAEANGATRGALNLVLGRRSRVACLLMLMLVLLPVFAGCGGAGQDGASSSPPPPAQATPPAAGAPAAATVGPSGGMVTSPAGAQVVVPAGALATEVAIAVDVAPAPGAPALPAGAIAFGEVFAFTPHGTTFAVPVTVAVPFDLTRLPAGTTPVLYKAEGAGGIGGAAAGWQPVMGATVQGASMSASVSGFSYFVVASPLQFNGLHRTWFFESVHLHALVPFGDEGHNDLGEIYDQRDLGPVHFITGTMRENAHARLYGNAIGSTYWAWVESPAVVLPTDRVGGSVTFNQTQFFTKRDEAASLSFVISEAALHALDFDPRPLECRPGQRCKVLRGYVDFTVSAFDEKRNEYFFVRDGHLYINGLHDDWLHAAYTSTDIGLWDESEASFVEVSASGGRDVMLQLNRPLRVQVPLGDVEVGSGVLLEVKLRVLAEDRRQVESGISAFFRDPQRTSGGIDLEFTGLDAAALPAVLPPPAVVQPAAACAGAADPAAGTLQFESASFVADEHAGPGALIFVTRTGGTRGRVSARVATTGGSAVAGQHYTPVSAFVAFADGHGGRRGFFVPITTDELAEPDRSVQLRLDDVRGCAAVGTPAEATLTIVDDDVLLPPPASLRVGGTVTGLVGSGLVLEDRAQFVELPIAANGAFEFNSNYASGAGYDVRVRVPPTNPAQICTITHGSGTVAASVSDIAVDCVTPPPPSGLDAGFGGGTGKVTAGPLGIAKAIALQPDGRIVAAIGNALARYLPDGTLDTAFGNNGSVADLLGTGSEVFDIAAMPDGRIVAAGMSRGTSLSNLAYDFAAARFNADGSRDASFNGGNVLRVDWIGAPDRATRVLLQPDGKIVLTGFATTVYTPTSDDSAFAAVRLNADGSLDTGFGNGGRAVAEFEQLDFGYASALQPDGKIVIAGRVSRNRSDESDVGIARFNADGSLDTGFGSGGKTVIDLSPNWDEAVSVAVQPDGRIALAVAYSDVGKFAFGLLRLKPDGSRDGSFGVDGFSFSHFGTGNDSPTALALQADGRIVVAGSTVGTGTSFDFVVARFLDNGTLDGSFGSGGYYAVDLFKGRDGAYDLLVQPDGKLLASGLASSGNFLLPLLVRVQP